jgi:hypothetical protein
MTALEQAKRFVIAGDREPVLRQAAASHRLGGQPIAERGWSAHEARRLAAAQEEEARRWIHLAQQAERACRGGVHVASPDSAG